jgi:Na+/proline symporter
MRLESIDWVIIAGFMLLSLAVGAYVSRRAGQDSASFFLSSRQMPWWLLGVSMVATTFSTDTPNLVTEIVRTQGVSGNWVWWAFLLTGMVTAFLYARLWRRAGVLTDLEFYELRYSGKAAVAVRAFRSIYLGVFFNAMVMALVTLAAIKIGAVILGATPLQTVLVVGTVTVAFTTLGGFLGVVITDLILFVASMTGAIATAWIAVNLPQVGGMSALLEHPAVAERLAFLPDFSNWEVALTVFVIPLAVQWWSVWYPGSEPGGGGYVAQRMLAAKDEDNALGAVLLFQVAHYALRPWPWILVALASLIVFPDLAAIQSAFPDIDQSVIRHDLAYPAMLTFLPAGLLGLVLASLAAAYMSTMSSQLNWGSSYLVNDFYQRFVRPDAPERELVLVGRISTIVLMLLACTMALYLESAMQAFNILLTIGAGTGLLFLLRWFWWRINAFSEIAAMAVSFIVALWFEFGTDGSWAFHHKLLIGIGLTTAAWLVATFAAPGTDDRTLEKFYRLIRPSGPGWQRVRDQLASATELAPTAPPQDNIPRALMNIFLGCIGTYGALFAIGSFIYGRLPMAGLLSAIAAIAFFLLLHNRYRRSTNAANR